MSDEKRTPAEEAWAWLDEHLGTLFRALGGLHQDELVSALTPVFERAQPCRESHAVRDYPDLRRRAEEADALRDRAERAEARIQLAHEALSKVVELEGQELEVRIDLLRHIAETNEENADNFKKADAECLKLEEALQEAQALLRLAVDGIELWGKPKYLHLVADGRWLESAKAVLK